jgi:diacylglycerol O-acyltransferase
MITVSFFNGILHITDKHNQEYSLNNHHQAREPFSNFDAFLLHIERPTNLMVISGLLFTDQPLDVRVLEQIVEQRLLSFERFQRRVVNSGLLVKTPKWEFDPTFKASNHVHPVKLPEPGDENALRVMVNELMAVPLDMSIPPWQLHLVENFGEGSVIIARLHHTLADGLSLVNVFTSLGDEAVGPDGMLARHGRGKKASGLGKLIVPPLKITSKLLGASQWALKQGLQMIENPDYLRDKASDVTDSAQLLGKYVIGEADPQTSLRGQVGIAKRAAWSRPIAVEKVKALGRQLGGTINDVMLAAVAGGLRRYFEARGEPIDYLDIKSIVPVNLRNNGYFANMGNQVGMVLMPLPVGEQDPGERFKMVKMRMDELKQSGEPDLIYSLVNMMMFKSKPLDSAMAGLITGKASLVVTNVPGPQEQITLKGRRIGRAVFWVPQPAGWGLGISLISYAGQITLGVAADASLIPEPEEILEGIEAELEEMEGWREA